MFNDHAKNANSQEADSSRIKDLRASKRRFEVSQRPCVRSVLHYEALVGTATAVMRGRHGRKEAKAAEEWLQKQTGEMALQLAMMGDAGDATLMLIRFFDQEFVDRTKLHQVLLDYHTRLRALFVDGLCLETGLTQLMLRTLQKEPKLVRLTGGDIVQIGGPESVTDDIVSRCLGRMAAWCRLGEEISKAEFPGFELFQSLAPFNLEPQAKGLEMDAKYIKESFSRLCKVLQLSPSEAYSEYCHYLPMAVEHYRQVGENFEAWKLALGRRPRSSNSSHGSTLKELVKRCGAWGGSTSGAEQSFAKQRTTQGLHRAEMSEEHVNTDAFLMNRSSGAKMSEDQVNFIKKARHRWATTFSDARDLRKIARSDKGSRHQRSQLIKTSEKGWLNQRRKEVRKGVLAGNVVKRAHGQLHWTAGHDAELDFQRKNNDKARCRHLQTVCCSSLRFRLTCWPGRAKPKPSRPRDSSRDSASIRHTP